MAVTLAKLAAQFDCELRGSGELTVDSVGTLAEADERCIAFLANPLYRQQLKSTRATGVVLEAKFADECPVAALVSQNPYATYARIAAFLRPRAPAKPGVHPTAVIADDATIASSASIGAHVHIDAGADIGANVVVSPGACIGAGAQIGPDTRVGPRVVVMDRSLIGSRCVLHAGAVIGSDGFGYARENDKWLAVPQLGRVVLGDDVDIGANTTIDRGTIADTVIESGVKLDNLIQIGHNVHIGEHTAMAALVGIAGSTRIGARCMIGGAVVIVGHISICDDVMVTFHSSVLRSIDVPGTYSSGIDADAAGQWRRNAARLRKLDSELRARPASRQRDDR